MYDDSNIIPYAHNFQIHKIIGQYIVKSEDLSALIGRLIGVVETEIAIYVTGGIMRRKKFGVFAV